MGDNKYDSVKDLVAGDAKAQEVFDRQVETMRGCFLTMVEIVKASGIDAQFGAPMTLSAITTGLRLFVEGYDNPHTKAKVLDSLAEYFKEQANSLKAEQSTSVAGVVGHG